MSAAGRGRIRFGKARIESVAPYYRAASQTNGPGVQIDLLIQSPRLIYVVEIKRRKHIGIEIEDEVEEKIRRLQVRKGVSVRAALVYQGDLDPRVRERGFFSVLVDMADLVRPNR